MTKEELIDELKMICHGLPKGSIFKFRIVHRNENFGDWATSSAEYLFRSFSELKTVAYIGVWHKIVILVDDPSFNDCGSWIEEVLQEEYIPLGIHFDFHRANFELSEANLKEVCRKVDEMSFL